MNEYLNVNKSKFGENMIKYYEMKNVLQLFDAYNKNDLKIKLQQWLDDIKLNKTYSLDESMPKFL